ncbi:MAG TPA: hypothetical protein VHE83_11310 [Mycobacteriales bacterium]|nr:hypothetical protein [Mycobacteriales bacterium]
MTGSVLVAAAGVASAHYAGITIVCDHGNTKVSFNYTSFPTTGTNTVTEVIKSDGTQIAQQTSSFTGDHQEVVVPFPEPASGTHTIEADASWSSSGDGVTGGTSASQSCDFGPSNPGGPPTVDIQNPPNGADLPQGSGETVQYTCSPGDGGTLKPGTDGCNGTVPDNSPVDDTPGQHCFTVTATQTDGQTSGPVQSCYTVNGPPQVNLDTPPTGNPPYVQGSTVDAGYGCTAAAGETIMSCTGNVPNGSPIDTSNLGSHCFTVTAVQSDQQQASVTHCYTVVAPNVLHYTGRAYDVGLNVADVQVVDLSDTGSVDTTSTSYSNTQNGGALAGLLGGKSLTSSVTTAPNKSSADANIVSLKTNFGVLLPTLGLPTIDTTDVHATDVSTCAGGQRTDAGTTTISYLKIGSTVIVGTTAQHALVTAGSVPPNTKVLNVPGLASLVLNEQVAIPGGQQTNAIHVQLLKGGKLVDLVLSSAESDIEGC